ncbi:MAG: hypothetical protein ACRDRK_07435 [Pseudonocardia sp.]
MLTLGPGGTAKSAADPRAAQAFAVDKVFHDAGTLAGPLLGALPLAVDFRVVALVAAVVFAVLTAAQLLVLPPRRCRNRNVACWAAGGRW